MHEFETHVDRIIASLHVSSSRKLEIRHELLSHLKAAYEEDLPEFQITRVPAQWLWKDSEILPI